MINISQITNSVSMIASALNGKWERKTVKDGGKSTTWVIMGQVVFLHGDESVFPYDVLGWHGSGDGGSWGILK